MANKRAKLAVDHETLPKDPSRKSAEKFVRSCLAIMDGSAEKGIRRIGAEKFEETVRAVMVTARPMRGEKANRGGKR